MENGNGMNPYDGMDTTGINSETFGVPGVNTIGQTEGMGSYANEWTTGSYTVPGYQGVEPEPMKKEGKALEVTTLVFGILALVVCCCNGFFGLVGLILGIVALAKGKRSGLTIAGLICSALALLLAGVFLLFSITDEGQTFWQGFAEGFEQGLEENYTIDSDDTYSSDDTSSSDDDSNSKVKQHEGAVLSSKEVGKITVDGVDYTIPCKLSEVLKSHKVNEYSQEELSDGLDSYDTKIIYLGEEGLGKYVMVSNYTEKKIADINDAMVETISVDDGGGTITIFNGITLGMTSAELESALQDIEYNKSEMSGYVFYNIYAGDNEEYSFSIMLLEDKIDNISVNYYSYE